MTYNEIHGNLLVQGQFMVPPSKPWPEHLWGMRLGKTVSHIRSVDAYVRGEPERRQWLDSIGFEWDDLKRQWESLQEALDTYWQEHGDLAVKRSFVVASGGPWSEKLWGMVLGSSVNSIRSNGTFVEGHPERRQWLEDRGFLFQARPSSAEQVRLAAAHHGRRRLGARFHAAEGGPAKPKYHGKQKSYVSK
jgi:hypothetical protein